MMEDRSNGKEFIYRSAPMSLIQLFISAEIGRDVVGNLGHLGLIQFRDLNSSKSGFQQTFVPEIRRLDDTIRQLNAIEGHLEAAGVPIIDAPYGSNMEPVLHSHEIEDLVTATATLAEKVSHISESREQLAARCDLLFERRHVLNACNDFLSGRHSSSHTIDGQRNHLNARGNDTVPLLGAGDDELQYADDFDIDDDEVLDEEAERPRRSLSEFVGSVSVQLVAGTISRDKYTAFERLAWRVTRGNLFLAKYPIETAISGKFKDIFIAYTHGDYLTQRLRAIASSMDAQLVNCNNSTEVRRHDLDAINEELSGCQSLLDSMLRSVSVDFVSAGSQIKIWKLLILKERGIFETMNKFDYDHGRRSLIAEGWTPSDEVNNIQQALYEMTQSAGISTPAVVHEINTIRKPPTYHRTNKVTGAFQAIVDVYGIATYQEANPALPAVVTFPFMFAIMFGDVGHGIILSLAALTLVVKEKSLAKIKRDEIFDMAYGGRYVLLLMGIFSIFTGFVYNDIFSKAMTIFSSGWTWPKEVGNGAVQATYDGSPYFFGLDWAWHGAENNLLFTNSYKMKLSVLMGFAHMTYSLFFQLSNARFHRSRVEILGNFIPGFLFMQSIFGYLSLMIVYKWCVDWVGKDWEAPGLLNMIINMFLSPGTIDAPLYRGQAFVQTILVLLALVCIPWLLLYKPLTLRKQNQSITMTGTHSDFQTLVDHVDGEYSVEDEPEPAQGQTFATAAAQLIAHDGADDEHHEEFEFGEVMIHQIIHTIEFCLNCVSHTASYLRLWALSLAHNQLSSVLWDMTIQNAFGKTGVAGIIMTVMLFGMWFVGTVVVLVCMEGTSAMLHSLRLHWVEAMSKHFEGEGYAFEPFDFRKLDV